MWMSSAEASEPFFPRHAVHPLAAWKDILRGNPIRARQVLKQLVVGPIRMEPMPKVHGYRWKGQLNGGSVLEGMQKYLWCRGTGAQGIFAMRPELLVPFAGEWAA